ncbi:MAG: hypothetical protein GX162_13495 [Firmicutes bacterium]|nr:hypothetical protein [Bacillota bacterium]
MMRWLSTSDLSFFFIAFCALTIAVVSTQSLILIASPAADRFPTGASFLAPAQTLFIRDKESQKTSLPLQMTMIAVGLAFRISLTAQKHCPDYFPTPASLPTDYRLFFLLPIFNSKYKD